MTTNATVILDPLSYHPPAFGEIFRATGLRLLFTHVMSFDGSSAQLFTLFDRFYNPHTYGNQLVLKNAVFL